MPKLSSITTKLCAVGITIQNAVALTIPASGLDLVHPLGERQDTPVSAALISPIYAHPVCATSTRTAIRTFTACKVDSTTGWCTDTVSYITTTTKLVDASTACPGPVASKTVSWFSQPNISPSPLARITLKSKRDRNSEVYSFHLQGTQKEASVTKMRILSEYTTVDGKIARYIVLPSTMRAGAMPVSDSTSAIPIEGGNSVDRNSVDGFPTHERPRLFPGLPAEGTIIDGKRVRYGALTTTVTMASRNTTAPLARPTLTNQISVEGSKVIASLSRVGSAAVYKLKPSKTKVSVVQVSSGATYTVTETVEPISTSDPVKDVAVGPRGTFHLKTKVFYGNFKFDNLIIQNPVNPKFASVPLLSHNVTAAAKFYFDYSTSSLALCCTKSNTTAGLVMVRDRDQDAYGTVLLGIEVGTARIAWECCENGLPDPNESPFSHNEPIVWKNDRFGSWLVCQRPVSGVFELRWWDVITNRGIDEKACAKAYGHFAKDAVRSCYAREDLEKYGRESELQNNAVL